MKYYAGLVLAYLTCDQRCAFSENTTGTIWCVFQIMLHGRITPIRMLTDRTARSEVIIEMCFRQRYGIPLLGCNAHGNNVFLNVLVSVSLVGKLLFCLRDHRLL